MAKTLTAPKWNAAISKAHDLRLDLIDAGIGIGRDFYELRMDEKATLRNLAKANGYGCRTPDAIRGAYYKAQRSQANADAWTAYNAAKPSYDGPNVAFAV